MLQAERNAHNEISFGPVPDTAPELPPDYPPKERSLAPSAWVARGPEESSMLIIDKYRIAGLAPSFSFFAGEVSLRERL